MARTIEDINKAKDNLFKKKVKSSEYQLPPGYIAGFQLEVNDEDQLIINKGIADIKGVRVEITETHIVSGEDFIDPDHILYTFTYYIYVNDKHQFLIDVIDYDYNVDFYGFYHYINYDYRYLGQFKIHTDGTYYDVFQQDPIKRGGMSTTAVEALFLAAINAAIIGYAGSGINESPTEGDRRVYIDDDEIGLEEYTGGSWSTVNGIKIGGAIAGLFLAMIGCTGIYHPDNPPTGTEVFPTSNFRIFNLENNYEDQNSLDDWALKIHTAFNSSIKKYGTYSLTTDGTTNIAYLQSPSNFTIDENQSFAGWVYIDTFTHLSDFMLIWWDGDNYIQIKFTVSGSDIQVDAVINKGGTATTVTGTTIQKEAWYYLGVSYDNDNGILYLVINNIVYSGSVSGTWDVLANSYQFVRVGDTYSGSQSLISYIDEIIFVYDEYIDPAIWVQHYNHGVTWNTTYAWSDILIQPNTNGRAYIPAPIKCTDAVTFDDDLSVGGDLTVTGSIIGAIENYDTGWVSCSDWTNVELSATHNLSATLDKLVVKLLISTDGTDATSFEPCQGLYNYAAGGSTGYGFTIYYVNANTIKIQTGEKGMFYIDDSVGGFVVIDTENWYYKIKVWKLG